MSKVDEALKSLEELDDNRYDMPDHLVREVISMIQHVVGQDLEVQARIRRFKEDHADLFTDQPLDSK